MPKSYDATTVELAMTLSTLAYVDENRIASQQEMIKPQHCRDILPASGLLSPRHQQNH